MMYVDGNGVDDIDEGIAGWNNHNRHYQKNGLNRIIFSLFILGWWNNHNRYYQKNVLNRIVFTSFILRSGDKIHILIAHLNIQYINIYILYFIIWFICISEKNLISPLRYLKWGELKIYHRFEFSILLPGISIGSHSNLVHQYFVFHMVYIPII